MYIALKTYSQHTKVYTLMYLVCGIATVMLVFAIIYQAGVTEIANNLKQIYFSFTADMNKHIESIFC